MSINPNNDSSASIYGIEWEYKNLKDEMLKRKSCGSRLLL